MFLLWALEKRDDSDRDDARWKRAKARATFWRVLVFTMFLCYPAISREIFSYFRCVAVPVAYMCLFVFSFVLFFVLCV